MFDEMSSGMITNSFCALIFTHLITTIIFTGCPFHIAVANTIRLKAYN